MRSGKDVVGCRLSVIAALIAVLAISACGARQPKTDNRQRAQRTLRVCADPNNLPYSNQKQQGFENEIASLIGVYLDITDMGGAMTLAHKLEQHESKAGRRREFISLMAEVADKRTPPVEFL